MAIGRAQGATLAANTKDAASLARRDVEPRHICGHTGHGDKSRIALLCAQRVPPRDILTKSHDHTVNTAPEIIVAHAAPIVVASHVRSTLLQSSLAFLRSRGHYERYVSLLDPAHIEVIVGTLAPTWLPIELGLAHYAACDALALDDMERIAIGEAVGDKIQGTFMSTLVKTVRGAGVTPWVLLERFDRLWGRLFQGGSVQLVKVGPKDLTIELRGAQLTRFEYFRTAFIGVVRAGFKLVGVRAAYVKHGTWQASSDRFVMNAAWV